MIRFGKLTRPATTPVEVFKFDVSLETLKVMQKTSTDALLSTKISR